MGGEESSSSEVNIRESVMKRVEEEMKRELEKMEEQAKRVEE